MTENQNQFPRFADLAGMAQGLATKNEYKPLVHIIKQAVQTQSCLSDIAHAQSCCDALDALLVSPRKRNSERRASTEGALLAHAIILYARATKSGSSDGGRGSSQVTDNLSDAEQGGHKAIVDVRDRAIAHVRDDEVLAGEKWHTGMVYVVETEDGWKPAAAKQTSQFNRSVFETLKQVLPKVDDVLVKRFHRKIDRATELMRYNPVPVAVFESNLIDPKDFFGGPDQVKRALAGMAEGRASGITHSKLK